MPTASEPSRWVKYTAKANTRMSSTNTTTFQSTEGALPQPRSITSLATTLTSAHRAGPAQKPEENPDPGCYSVTTASKRRPLLLSPRPALTRRAIQVCTEPSDQRTRRARRRTRSAGPNSSSSSMWSGEFDRRTAPRGSGVGFGPSEACAEFEVDRSEACLPWQQRVPVLGDLGGQSVAQRARRRGRGLGDGEILPAPALGRAHRPVERAPAAPGTTPSTAHARPRRRRATNSTSSMASPSMLPAVGAGSSSAGERLGHGPPIRRRQLEHVPGRAGTVDGLGRVDSVDQPNESSTTSEATCDNGAQRQPDREDEELVAVHERELDGDEARQVVRCGVDGRERNRRFLELPPARARACP